MPDQLAWPGDRNRGVGRSALLRRSARPHGCSYDRGWRQSSLERAARLRHRKIGARHAQDLVGLEQGADLALQGLQLLGQLAWDAGAVAAVDLGPSSSTRSASAAHSRSWSKSTGSPTIGIRAGPDCPEPAAPRSRTSAENLLVVLLMMLHPSQKLEPPANPARFSCVSTCSVLLVLGDQQTSGRSFRHCLIFGE